MKTVYTKEELQQALENREEKIEVRGELAQKIYRNAKRKKLIRSSAGLIGVLAIIGGIALTPVTGGASLVGAAAGLTATGLIAGTITLTATEILILCGSAIVLAAILKGAKVTFQRYGDGRVIVIMEPQYKDVTKEVDYGVN